MGKKTKTVLAFASGAAVGAAVGAAAGILFAPEKGRETRNWLSYRLEKYRDTISDLLEQLVEDRNLVPSTAKSEGQRVIQDAKDKAEKLLGDVDSLINEINSRKEI
ncbi:YtxH domain-containing protein [Pontibacter sp. SGAir0037]|uniref:YtxH domain-containing protein n=1 Tax=Pontibacter sp. SGAir0037 TaxID=2571030 RepID=UPI0010CD5959|nr:YtxH domain-containing protein [Pontibacter sp. SGAir0037]QCR24080.1 gas vesicle protein [Pontibacter sp. SGAir0037]